MLIVSLLIDTIAIGYYDDIIVTRWHRHDVDYAPAEVADLDAERGVQS